MNKLAALILDVAEELIKYSIEMEHMEGARLTDAVFMRVQAERLVNAIERLRA